MMIGGIVVTGAGIGIILIDAWLYATIAKDHAGIPMVGFGAGVMVCGVLTLAWSFSSWTQKRQK
jgi:hypothetical protein